MFGKGVYFADVGHCCDFGVMLIADSDKMLDGVEGVFVVRK